MEQNDEHLVDKKIAEAKLEMAKDKIHFLLWFFGIMLTIVGVAIPLFLSNRASDKVDEAILDSRRETKEMRETYEKKAKEIEGDFQTKVKEVSAQQKESLSIISANADKTVRETKDMVQSIIGQQLAKPELTLRFNGEEINGKTINVSEFDKWNEKFEIYNKGKVTARNVRLVLYQKESSKLEIQKEIPWMPRGVSEEKGYTNSYNYDGVATSLEVIDPLYPAPLYIGISLSKAKKEIKEELLIKIYYGQPEPTKIFFSIERKQN